jgi:hypothetical protein
MVIQIKNCNAASPNIGLGSRAFRACRAFLINQFLGSAIFCLWLLACHSNSAIDVSIAL